MAVPKPNIIRVGGIPAGNFGGKRGIRPTHITLHHIVGDAAAAIAEARNPARQMSFTFTIGSDGQIYQALELDDWPYTDGNSTSNRRAITIEHAGGTASVPYTQAMYNSSVHLCAWLRQEFGIPKGNMLRHGQVSEKPTACPGGLNTDYIKTTSTQLLMGGGKGGGEMSKDALTKEEVIELHYAYFIGGPGAGYGYNHVGGPLGNLIHDWKNSSYRQAVLQRYNAFDTLTKQVSELTKLAEELRKNPTAEAYEKLQEGLEACTVQANEANAKVAEFEAEKAGDEKTGLSFMRWLARFFKREG